MPHGSIVELDADGAPARWRGPDGAVIAEIGGGIRLALAGLHDHPVTVGPDREPHLVLGEVQPIRAGEAETIVARVAATDWRRPAHIPAIDAPAKVPAGAGSALLNVLALAGRTLRYRGPYATAALYASLCESFRPAGTEAAFVDGALERAMAGESAEVAVDFTPAPFERVQIAPRGVVHLRDGVERLYLGGLAWSRAGARRLVTVDDHVQVGLWIGGALHAEVAVLARDGRLVSGPRPLPPVRSSVIGKSFPPPLIAALRELLIEGEPPLLAAAMREVLTDVPIVWGDPGADAARPLAGAIVVHAALWDRLGGAPIALAAALAEVLVTPVKQLAQARLETVPIGTALN